MADTLSDGYFSLSDSTNKVAPSQDTESVISEYLPELTLDMKDDELITLKNDWVKQWQPYEKEILEMQTDNENYWLGKQFNQSEGKRPLVDNLIFESLETFLPIATRPNLQALVSSDNSVNGNEVADKMRRMLQYQLDNLSYNLTLKQVTRYWALYLLGVIKVGWSMKNNDISIAALRPQKLVLDPHATIENCEYTGYYIGEEMEDMASDLVLRFPKKETYIKDKVKDKMGTSLKYYLWTTDEYVFWTHDQEVLGKNKNPHWNYDTEQPGQMDETGQMGQPAKVPGKNHFTNKKKPYVFLTFFNLGKRPHDDTNLIQQNLPLQDSINKRLVQMDKNADNANGGMLVSGDAYTEEQAAALAKALRKGGVGWVPTGDPRSVVLQTQASPLPQFVYQALVDYRGELRNIFGIRGSSPQGLSGERTVRGKMFMQQQDQARIGGGISTALEEFSDEVLNWFVQLMYVYYDEPHTASILGKENTQEYLSLSNQELGVKLLVGVKEGSMIPKDPESEREEAMQLWGQKGIDPITFFEKLDFPDPRGAAKNLFLWLSDPIQLFPDLAEQAAQNAKPQNKPPSVAINFKDLPPEGQQQAAQEAGIQLSPMQIVQNQAQQQLLQTQQKVHDHALSSQTAQTQHERSKELLA